MSAQDQDEGTRTAFTVLIPLLVLVLVVGFVVGLGIHKAKGPKAQVAVMETASAAPEAAPAAVDVSAAAPAESKNQSK